MQKSSQFTAVLPWSPSCHICVKQRFKGLLEQRSEAWGQGGVGRGGAVSPSQSLVCHEDHGWTLPLKPLAQELSGLSACRAGSPGLLPVSRQAAHSAVFASWLVPAPSASLCSQAETAVFTGASGGVCMCRVLLFHLVHGKRCISRAPTG